MPLGSILIVDDAPGNLAILRRILAPHYRLTFASSGIEALSLANKQPPALVLLDVQLPDMDGYEVCRRLKEIPDCESTPVIFVTTMGEVGDERKGFDAGGVDYIVKPVSAPIVLARVGTHMSLVKASRLEEAYKDALFMLGTAGHYNDTDTGVHIWRMAAFARHLAEQVGWTADAAQLLELAAPMHDTGKIGIPDSILRKPGPLDDEEWVIMRSHSRIGCEILSRSKAPVFALAAEVALRHHERWDGTGYPDALVGDAIPESARIVALADVFDALTMRRPYKEAWHIDRVVATLKSSAGSHFEPRLVEAFLDSLDGILEIKRSWDERE